YQLGDVGVLDEAGHYAQIVTFHEGKLEIFYWPGKPFAANAMLPGFHAVVARVMSSHAPTPETLRIYCFLISLFCFPVAYLLEQSLGIGKLSLLRAGQVYILPLLFPFHFLIYTDSFSTLILLLALLACIRGRPILCGMMAFGAMLVRQPNVLFVAFLLAYSYVEVNGSSLSFER